MQTRAAMRSEQAGTKLSFALLVVMAAMFFVPTLHDGHPRSASDYAFIDLRRFFWILPVFAASALLALLTVRVLALGEVERGDRRAALLLIATLAVTTVVSGLWNPFNTLLDPLLFPGPLLGTALAVALIRRARGRQPPAIWDHLMAAFACVAAGSGPPVFGALDLLLDPTPDVLPAGWVYLAAVGTLLVSSLWRLRARR